MQTRLFLSIATLALGVGAAQPVLAEATTPEARSAAFSQLDRDDDGRISKQEARKDRSLAREWRYTDRNGDGALEPSEFSAYETRKAEARKEIPSQE